MTIMLNYIAAGLLAYLLTTTAFQRPGRTDPISPIVDWNATFPRLEGGQLHLGFVLALLAAVVVWWLLDRSTTGFAIRAVGANPHAAATAGMSVARTTIITMVLAGALAGLAGVQAALGPTRLRACRCRCRPASSARSASTPSPSPCSAGPSRSAPCWPGCSSARCTPAGWPCRASPRPR